MGVRNYLAIVNGLHKIKDFLLLVRLTLLVHVRIAMPATGHHYFNCSIAVEMLFKLFSAFYALPFIDVTIRIAKKSYIFLF